MKHADTSAAIAQDRTFADPIDDLPLPYIELDANGIVVRANRATLALHPAERGPLVGKLAWDFMAADEKDPSFASFCSALESGEEPPAVRRSLYDSTGHFRSYELHRSLVRDCDGKPVGMRLLCVDVTKTSKAYEETHRRLVQLRSVLDSIGEAVIVADAMGFILAMNPAAEALLHGVAAEMKDTPIEQVLPILGDSDGSKSNRSFTQSLECAWKGSAAAFDCARREFRAEISASPIVDKENGSTTGVVFVLREQ